MVFLHTDTPLRIDNKTARHLWLSTGGLSTPGHGTPDVLAMIKQLGFVQLDSIQVVARAHHHILWSRNQHYREEMLDQLLAEDRSIFEHFTHDASVIPMAFLPFCQRQFQRKKAQLDRADWYKGLPDKAARKAIVETIRQQGPLSTHAFDTKIAGQKEMWSRPPHKLALDYMWYAGELATSHRINFTKYYDLAERVFPSHLTAASIPDQDQIDWLCHAALDRMGFGSATEIQHFWDSVSAVEVKAWLCSASMLREVDVQRADKGWMRCVAPANIEDRIAALTPPSSRLRILNPFDPVIRDRNRLMRLFGFEYRVEMFVPAAKRVWGYYVFPILEGHRFIGRVEIIGDRKAGTLTVKNLWPEKNIQWTHSKNQKLNSELLRLQRLISAKTLIWQDGAALP